MKIKLAKHMGYCFGVRRAMDLAFSSLAQDREAVFSYGPLIHNGPALELLKNKGLKIWDGTSVKGTVIIRAHGLSPEAEAELRSRNLNVLDATCPRVAKVQRLVAHESGRGRGVIIWGTEGHPEVDGLMGYATGQGKVISSPDDVEYLPDWKEVLLVAQTTQDKKNWPVMVEAVKARWLEVLAVDTICEATGNRQLEASRLSREVDALVVVGGKNSANTRRLYEIGDNAGIKTISVEGPAEIEPSFIDGVSILGLVAGASTPIWQLRTVLQKLESLGRIREQSPAAFTRRFIRALTLSNIYVGLGAGCLGWAMSFVAGIKLPDYFFGLFFFYVQAMHLLNGFLDSESARYNDPDRANFLRKYRFPLIACGLTSLILSLTASALAGFRVLTLLIGLSFLGLIYAVPIPVRSECFYGVRRLKDLPMSKTLSIALGWSTLLCWPGFLHMPPLIAWSWPGLVSVMWAWGAVFLNLLTRSLIMDIQDAHGDRMFGSTTLVTFLGQKRAVRFLIFLTVIWTAYLLAAWYCGRPNLILWLWFSGPLYNILMLPRLLKNSGLGGFQFDLLLDGQFLLSGLLVLIWSL